MAHFSLIRPGGWATLTVDGGTTDPALSTFHTELETLDANLYKAVNGDEGGTWAPAAAVIINGAGLRVDGPLSLSNVTLGAVFGNVVLTYGHSVTVNSGGHLEAQNGSASIIDGGSSWTFTDTATLALTGTSSLQASSTSTVLINGTCAFTATNATTYVAGSRVIHNGETASGTETRTGQTVLDGPLASVGLRDHTYSDANQNIDPGVYDVIFLPPHMVAARTYTCNLPANNAPCQCTISREAGTGFTFKIKNNAGVDITPTLLSSLVSWVELQFDTVAVDWICTGYGFGG